MEPWIVILLILALVVALMPLDVRFDGLLVVNGQPYTVRLMLVVVEGEGPEIAPMGGVVAPGP